MLRYEQQNINIIEGERKCLNKGKIYNMSDGDIINDEENKAKKERMQGGS